MPAPKTRTQAPVDIPASIRGSHAYVEEAWDRIHSSSAYGTQVFRGQLLHFREVDDSLNLPPGTAKRLLAKTAEDRYYVEPTETQNTIRFRLDREAWETSFEDEDDEE